MLFINGTARQMEHEPPLNIASREGARWRQLVIVVSFLLPDLFGRKKEFSFYCEHDPSVSQLLILSADDLNQKQNLASVWLRETNLAPGLFASALAEANLKPF
ncbi:hypothetical protein Tsubulata_048769 [Turnera subulata]|uniref:Uncharacterized protein n=1 Tax=Turnera subulata TaxID=218843 RepID=A0A9Q0FUA9_9ROSI|nr:hypothetical protein Tsubulata_048769 [Turnera subulata]